MSDEPFMMFVDSDDLLASPYAVHQLYNHYEKPENNDIVMISGNFFEELKGGYIKHEKRHFMDAWQDVSSFFLG